MLRGRRSAGRHLRRKRLLVIGVVIFASTSAIAGAAVDPTMVVGLRVLQGVGAAIAFPVSLAVVTNAFPPHRVQRAIGIMFGIAVLGAAVGPFLGRLIAELLSWRFVFWLNVPIAAVVVWLVLTVGHRVPRRVGAPSDGRPGALLIVSGVALVSFTFDRATDWGWTSAATVGSIVGGLVLLRPLRGHRGPHALPAARPQPVPHPRLRHVIIAGGSARNIVYTVMILAWILYLQQVHDLSPIMAGIIFLALSFGAAAAGQLSGRVELCRRGW